MNCKRCCVAAIAAFIFVFVYEWAFHGILMADMYAETANLWRSEAEMQEKFALMLAGQLLFAIMATLIFIRGYEGRGIGEGVRYGLYLGLLMAAPNFMWYVVAPYPLMMVVGWTVGGLIEMILLGVLLAVIYKR